MISTNLKNMDMNWEGVSCFSSVQCILSQAHNSVGYFQCCSAKNILLPETSVISHYELFCIL